MNFFVQWTMLTVDQHYLDFPATLPLYSSPRTYYVWEFHLTYPGLFKISPFIKDLGVSYKVTPIISVSRISQCNHFEFPPLLQSLFIYFFFVHVLWFDIRSFWRFRRWEANYQKLFHSLQRVLDHFRDKKFHQKMVWTLRKNNQLQKKL